MFNIGPPEILLILLIALVVVGPAKLPELGRSIGKGLREFRKVQDEVRDSINISLDAEPDTPKKPPTPRTPSKVTRERAAEVAHDVTGDDAHPTDAGSSTDAGSVPSADADETTTPPPPDADEATPSPSPDADEATPSPSRDAADDPDVAPGDGAGPREPAPSANGDAPPAARTEE